jgi:hypothetical protein
MFFQRGGYHPRLFYLVNDGTRAIAFRTASRDVPFSLFLAEFATYGHSQNRRNETARTIHQTPTNRTLARSLRHGEVRGGFPLHVLPPFAPLARWHSTTALEGRLTGGGMTESAWPSQPLRVSRDLSPRARAAGRAYWRRWCYYHAASSAEGEKKSVEDSDFKRLRERGLRCQSRSSAAAGQRLPGNPQAVIDRSIDSRIRLALQQPVLSAWLNSEKISCILAKISLKFSGSID